MDICLVSDFNNFDTKLIIQNKRYAVIKFSTKVDRIIQRKTF